MLQLAVHHLSKWGLFEHPLSSIPQMCPKKPKYCSITCHLVFLCATNLSCAWVYVIFCCYQMPSFCCSICLATVSIIIFSIHVSFVCSGMLNVLLQVLMLLHWSTSRSSWKLPHWSLYFCYSSFYVFGTVTMFQSMHYIHNKQNFCISSPVAPCTFCGPFPMYV